MTAEELRTRFDWSNTKPDMVDRVIRAVESQIDVIEACTGELKPDSVITWCDYDHRFPLSANCFSFRRIGGLVDGESIIATPKS